MRKLINGRTALHTSASIDNIEMVKYCAEKWKLNVDAKDIIGWTPL
jgi:ankyrin repeat protein